MILKGILIFILTGVSCQENDTWTSTSEGVTCREDDCAIVEATTFESEQSVTDLPNSTSIPHTTQTIPVFPTKESCFCDINKFTCDVDCCCDSDCSDIEKQAFSKCIQDSSAESSNYCISEYVLYKNNTKYKTVKTSSNLLCIAKDNLPVSLKFVNTKVITSLKNFNKVLKRKRSFFWPNNSRNRVVLDSQYSYTSGSEIWVFNTASKEHPLTHLDIPSVGTSTVCQRRLKVKFMKNIFSSCLVRKPVDKNECENSLMLDPSLYIKNMIVTSPVLFNFSNIQGIPKEVLTKIDLTVCQNETCQIVNQTSSPSFIEKSKICKGVLKTVQCLFKHNGSAGIVKVDCQITVGSVQAEEASYFRQSYKIDFDWIDSLAPGGFPRSGQPGYSPGRPIISGTRVVKTIYDVDTEVVTPILDRGKWISLPLVGNDGLCSSNRVNLLFEENLKTSCSILVSPEDLKNQECCANISHRIWKEFLGIENINNTEIGLLSSWGDPREDRRSWVPLLLDSDNPLKDSPRSCSHLPTNFELKFLTAQVGPLDGPQSKLVAAVVTPKQSPVKCISQVLCRIALSASVTFIDISGPVKTRFAAPPIITISLPKDFFYPFSSSSNHLFPNSFFTIILFTYLMIVYY